MIFKWIGYAVLGLIALGVLIWALRNRKFFKESWQELMKVTWPTKDEALHSALVTIGFVVAFSLILATIDYFVNLIVLKLVG